jgi:triacylglycerol lipase
MLMNQTHRIDLRRHTPPRDECVILLHGLYRTAASMALIEHHLIRQGYGVINIDYASTRSDIASVACGEVSAAVAAAKKQGYDRIHVVTHSLGALVIRAYLQDHRLPEGSRIVMLAPPNQGSELADWAYQTFPKLRRVAGPAANQLGTRDRPFASRLDPVSEPIGILIGEKSWNPFSSKILPGQDDGAVPLERAKLQEMQDFMVVPCNHSSIILNKNVRYQIVRFLQRGRFDRPGDHK